MNIKAERIEQLIQLVNRNLQQIYSGQQDGIIPIERRPLQKVDAVIFGQDKFAYEMVYFLNSAQEKIDPVDDSIFSQWESNFVRGLESLLVECAVITDEIERDCFVSRVYCWFSEKLSERREVPRNSRISVEELKKSVGKLTNSADHTMKALDTFNPQSVVDHRGKLMEDPVDPQVKFGPPETRELPPINVRLQTTYPQGMKRVPSYVKHNYPNVFPAPDHDTSFLPKIPGADDGYGMLYNKPETEAEKKMNELWLARRRQEAFDYKTQQQLAIVMDRLALHKSRLESDTLRKQESEAMLKGPRRRPQTTNDIFGEISRPNTSTAAQDANALTLTSFSATSSPTRYRGISHKLTKELESPITSPERRAGRSRSPHGRSVSPSARSAQAKADGRSRRDYNADDRNHSVSVNDGEKESLIPPPSRTAVLKGGKRVHAPMRFKIDLPDGFAERQQYYMQLSDSDDDDRPERQAKATTSAAAGKGGNKKKGGGGGGAATTKVEAIFRHERPILRERPASARQFRTIALNDPEIKVHYRHTNYRRMPLTQEQEQWLDEREVARSKKSEAVAKELLEAFQAKNDKKKDKDKKDGKKDAKKDDKKGGKDAKGSRPTTAKGDANKDQANELRTKYKSASQFMAVNFPNFEDNENLDRMAPMRKMQLMEVSEIVETFKDYNMTIKDTVLKKALIIPQDKPEAVCLENLREEKEGLFVNPKPPEYWRKMVIKASSKKGGKKKKK